MAWTWDKEFVCVLEFVVVMVQPSFQTCKTIREWYETFQQNRSLCAAKQTGLRRPSAETVERVRASAHKSTELRDPKVALATCLAHSSRTSSPERTAAVGDAESLGPQSSCPALNGFATANRGRRVCCGAACFMCVIW
jgi:hypothetical protein